MKLLAYRASSLLVALLVASGCETQSPEPASGSPASFSVASAIEVAGLRGAPEGASSTDRLRALSDAHWQAEEIVSGAPTWAEADAAFRAAMSQSEPIDRWALGQTAAIVMLRGHLLEGSSTPEKYDAVDFYLPYVTGTGNPDVEMVTRALNAYPDLWTPAERAEIVDAAIDAGRTHIASKLNCGADCEMTPAQLETIVGDPETREDVRLARIATAIEDLEAIARSEG